MRSRFPIYEKLTRLYPQPYREKYAEQMVQTLADMLEDQPGKTAKARVWLRTSLDLPLSLAQQNLIYVGGIMKTATPNYVKRNSIIAAALTLPFFVIVFSRTLQHNHTYNSFAWQSSLWITLVALPLAACLLCAYTFIKWSRSHEISLRKSLLDIRHSWMLTGVGLLALMIAVFVPFHDSTHCVTGNPIREIRNAGQTWHCIWRG